VQGLADVDFRSTGRFQVLRRLGEGGMGVVYEALDRERGERVALKTLRTLSADALLRFKNEFRALQDLQHPNLCTLGELIGEGSQWFFTMELIDGVDLFSWVRPTASRVLDSLSDIAIASALAPGPDRPASSRPSNSFAPGERPDRTRLGALDVERLRAALIELSRGVSALHVARVVHRDIKPSNVLVEASGRVVLLDFGLATGGARSDQSDIRVVGTADYMAPEQASGKAVGPAADWYSVGVVLYEALTGAVPFAGSPLEVLLHKQRSEPPPPRSLNPDVPVDLDEVCVSLLRRDPQARWDGRRLVERLGRPASLESAPAPVSESRFVGREDELAALAAAFAHTRAGNSVTVQVRGESGVGKTALVRRFVEGLQREQPGSVVLRGRCYERESVPYKAVDGVVDALSRWLAKLPAEEAAALVPPRAWRLSQVFPVLRRVPAVAQAPRPRHEAVDPTLLRQMVFKALRELLRRIAATRALVMVIDDLQWADADSLALVDAITRPPAAPALLLLATVRTGKRDTRRAQRSPLAAAVDARVVPLQRLPPAEARALAAELLQSSDGDRSRSAELIAEEAAGHPQFIEELVRHSARDDASGTPLHLEEALWGRILELDPEARQLLELVAVAGGPLMQQAAAAAASMELADLARHVATLRAAKLVRTSGMRPTDFVEPYHDRVRIAIEAHRSQEQIRAAHERVAIGLQAAPRADSEMLAAHWQAAGHFDKAAVYATQAADRAAAAFAFVRAAQLYRKSLQLRPSEAAETHVLRMKLADVLAYAGRGTEAAQVYLETAERATADEALLLRRRASEELLRAGHVDEGLAALRQVLDAVHLRYPKTPRSALASVIYQRAVLKLRGLRITTRDTARITPLELVRIDAAWAVAVGLSNIDTVRGADFAARHLSMALAAGEPARIARALAFEACLASTMGPSEEPRVQELAAIVLADRADRPHARALAEAALAICGFARGEWRRAATRLQQVEQRLRERCRGVSWELATSQLIRLCSLAHLGELDQLAQDLTSYLLDAEERGDLYAEAAGRMGIPNLVWLVQDLPDEGRVECEEAIGRWSNQAFHMQHSYYLNAMTNIDLYRGDGPGAYARMRAVWPQLKGSHIMLVCGQRIFFHDLLGRAALAAAHHAKGQERRSLLAVVRKSIHKNDREGIVYATAMARQLEAGLAHLGGDSERAMGLLDVAAAGFEELDMKMHAALARGRQGELVGGDRGRELTATMTRWTSAQHIAAPERFADVIAPWLKNPD
jgi:hypothetical protein